MSSVRLPLRPRSTTRTLLAVGAAALTSGCGTTRLLAGPSPAVEIGGPAGTISAGPGAPLTAEAIWSAGDAVYDCLPWPGSPDDGRNTADAIELRLVFGARGIRLEGVHSKTGIDEPTRRCIEQSLLGIEWSPPDGDVTLPLFIGPPMR